MLFSVGTNYKEENMKELLTCREDIIGDDLIDVRRIITGRSVKIPIIATFLGKNNPLHICCTEAQTRKTFELMSGTGVVIITFNGHSLVKEARVREASGS